MSCASAAVLKTRAGCAAAPTNGVTMYPVMPAPFAFGATQLTRTVALPRVTFGLAGASGAPIRTGADATENFPKPTLLCARTLNVYVTPFFKPVIVCAFAALLKRRAACAFFPMYGVTEYWLIGEPWFAG